MSGSLTEAVGEVKRLIHKIKKKLIKSLRKPSPSRCGTLMDAFGDASRFAKRIVGSNHERNNGSNAERRLMSVFGVYASMAVNFMLRSFAHVAA